jgi:hypothetical protein
VEVAIGVGIGVLAYLAVGVVVLSRAEGMSALHQITFLGVPNLLGILAWPALLALRLHRPVAAPGEASPAPPDRGYIGAEAEVVTDLRPWAKCA